MSWHGPFSDGAVIGRPHIHCVSGRKSWRPCSPEGKLERTEDSGHLPGKRWKAENKPLPYNIREGIQPGQSLGWSALWTETGWDCRRLREHTLAPPFPEDVVVCGGHSLAPFIHIRSHMALTPWTLPSNYPTPRHKAAYWSIVYNSKT